MGTLVSINVSEEKGTKKVPVARARLGAEGIEGDAHAGAWHRMVSLLAEESVDKMRAAGLDVGPGAFAENLTTRGLDLLALPLGTRLRVGADAVLELTQHGKECHSRCAIYYQAGDCVMPREGVFARVQTGGEIHTGDEIVVEERKLEG
ncbi:MAG: MOSC domain-containing protein [Deltaproteobacteria bacterium]|nr:MOSC domain-containing protein [Deltaproteobacteria bacterium]